jgi:glycine C-acetyltransferase
LIDKLWENTRYFKGALAKLGFDIGKSETPITPVIAGSAERAHKLSDRLFEEGVFAQGIGFPTVPEGKARVRTIISAAHTQEQMDTAIAAFEKVGRELGII